MDKRLLLGICIMILLLVTGCVDPNNYPIGGNTMCSELCIEEGLNYESQSYSTCKCTKLIAKSEFGKRHNLSRMEGAGDE